MDDAVYFPDWLDFLCRNYTPAMRSSYPSEDKAEFESSDTEDENRFKYCMTFVKYYVCLHPNIDDDRAQPLELWKQNH